LRGSVEQFLEDVAHRGSWFGGGSVAALAAALSASLLRKLTTRPAMARKLQRIQRGCSRLVERDAAMFARVIQATRTHNRAAFERSLKTATEVPYQVFAYAHDIQAACRVERRAIKPQFQSDLVCVMALSQAAAASARALIRTNLAWLRNSAYSARMTRRLRSASRPRRAPRRQAGSPTGVPQTEGRGRPHGR